MARSGEVIVVGGGVIGAAVAAAAAETGWRVVVLEREAEPGRVASAASFAWVNAWNKHPEAYAELNRAGIAAHAAGADRWFQTLTARLPDGSTYAEGGVADAVAFVRAHLAVVTAHGGVVRTETDVVAVETGRVVLAGGEEVRADLIVIAAGTASAGLLPPDAAAAALGDGRGAPGFVARVRAPGHGRHDVLWSVDLNVRPAGPDELLVQSVTLEEELADGGIEPTIATAAEALRARAAARGVSFGRDDVLEVRAAVRPQPSDGLPVVGWAAASVYLVVTHSGVTLAPALGPLVAAELGGAAQPELAPFRPDRRPSSKETSHVL